ncbi:MAG: tRNA dihydrouridine synthase DusB [Bacteroidetes bacterium]|nr:tRNA dihydrouridine synthase DusB [Bacteroidota bacterium]
MNIGKIHIDTPIALAPMESITDVSFRLICKEHGADLVYTEFINSEGIIRNSNKTLSKMTFSPQERPIGIQLYGSNPESMQRAAHLATEVGPDFLDINCGCWVRNVVNNGAGADLLRDLPRMERIIKSVVSTTSLPVTVKTRLGWDLQSINILDIAKIVEQAGAAALTIHCRTRSQGHKGDPDYSWIKLVKNSVSIPIIANGSLHSPQKIKLLLETTHCDGVMIGRAAIGAPWIFSQTKNFLSYGTFSEPSIKHRLSTILRHLQLAVEYKGEYRGVIEFRKFYAGYLKGLPNSSKIRQVLMTFVEIAPIIETLHIYFESIAAVESIENAHGQVRCR